MKRNQIKEERLTLAQEMETGLAQLKDTPKTITKSRQLANKLNRIGKSGLSLSAHWKEARKLWRETYETIDEDCSNVDVTVRKERLQALLVQNNFKLFLAFKTAAQKKKGYSKEYFTGNEVVGILKRAIKAKAEVWDEAVQSIIS